jgi:hypothetical protein
MEPDDVLDPRAELREILELSGSGALPRDAALWASSALKSTNNIFYKAKVLNRQGINAPTPSHRTSLIDIDTGAKKWLATISQETRQAAAPKGKRTARKRGPSTWQRGS